MKNLSLVLNIVLFVLVGILFYLHFNTNENKAKNTTVENRSQSEDAQPLKIAYLNLDSLEAHYSYFQEKSATLNQKKEAIRKELTTKMQSIQNDIQDLKEKASTLTMAQGKAAQKKIVEKRQQLQKRRQTLQTQLVTEQQKFNKELHARLNQFLQKYNEDKHNDFIFSYSSGLSPLLYRNEAYNITDAVIEGLNAEDQQPEE